MSTVLPRDPERGDCGTGLIRGPVPPRVGREVRSGHIHEPEGGDRDPNDLAVIVGTCGTGHDDLSSVDREISGPDTSRIKEDRVG